MCKRLLGRVISCALLCTLCFPSLPSRAAAAASGATVAARDGCANQWMFNGVWRVRITGFAPHIDSITKTQTGWDVTEQWRNGTDRTLSPVTDSFSLSQQLELHNGVKITTQDTTTSTLSQQQVDYHQFPPSAQFTQVQNFVTLSFDASNKPEAVIIPFDVAKLQQYPSHPAFSINPPNYRIKFDCTPSEMAHAAKGGSYEVQAHEGCLNQWLSNGLWRVRIHKLEPSLDKSTNLQNGWLVTQDWVNLTGRSIIPNSTAMQDQQIVLQNSDTVSTSNTTTTTLNFQQLGFHTFAPGASFTYTQQFWPSGTFDASNKPVKLLMMFDAKSEARNSGLPQFHSGPANIRVSFDCTK